MTKNAHTTITPFNTELHLTELNERFGRLIKNFGVSNKKGTERYNFEVNFAYAVNEITQSPAYMQGKMFDKATSIIGRMISALKTKNETPVIDGISRNS